MASGIQKRTRTERVAAVELPPGQWERMWDSLRRRDVLARIFLALLVAVLLCLVTEGWYPPFAYQTGYTPRTDIVARVSFSNPDPVATEVARDLARRRVREVYMQNPEPLEKLRALLYYSLAELVGASSFDEATAQKWREFAPPPSEDAVAPSPAQQLQEFEQFRETFGTPERLATLRKQLAAAFAPFEAHGLLSKLPRRENRKGNSEEIAVYLEGKPDKLDIVKLHEVMIGDGKAVYQSLLDQFESSDLADRFFAWVKPRLTTTLSLDDQATQKALQEAAAGVSEVLVKYEAGQTLVPAGQTLDHKQMQVLQLEHEAANAQRTKLQNVARASAVVAGIFTLLFLCGLYMRYRHYAVLTDSKQFIALLSLALVMTTLAYWLSADAWQAELIPILLFGMTLAVAYRQELALIITGVLGAVVSVAVGQGLHEFMVVTGVSIVVILQVGQIRSRAKLVHVGLISGCVAAALEIVLSILDDQPINQQLLLDGCRCGLWTLAAGFLMTGLLPFIEKWFDVLTDLSLLELGDVSHPLLQELVRRAPATYNHSITVGSIAEAAAESIGGRGLLVRVGAYFHDIGKMLKPGYFVENQGTEASRHETLLPAMSTLVIIAHIKDGSDLGRTRRLPLPIIDLIEQHHGTTLVEYFYGRAQDQKESDPNGGEVDETAYRYPGPKPQTKEAVVLMLADAVESACRSLVEPTPARIESLVEEIAERRLRDGQFDESGLTLRELRTIELSLVKSLTALYHGRIKYPEQKTA